MKFPMGVLVPISAAVGLASGYAIAHWRLSSIFADQADAEIEEMRAHYEERYNPQPEEESESVNDIHPSADSPLPAAIVEDEDRVEYHKVVSGHYRMPINEVGIVEDDEEFEPGKIVHEDGQDLYEVVSSEVMGMNEYEYDDTVYLTYHYHEDLLVDFWGQRVRPESYIGKLPIPKPEDNGDSINMCVVNHADKMLVDITIDVDPIPNGTYAKNEEYIKARWLELQEASERLRARERGE